MSKVNKAKIAAAPTAPVTSPTFKVSLGALADAFEAIISVAAQTLKGSVSLQIVSFINALKVHYLTYNEARRTEALKYGELVDESKVQISPANQIDFNAAMAELRSRVVTFETDPCLSVDILDDITISPNALNSMLPFFAKLVKDQK